jgi:hypothetical protein
MFAFSNSPAALGAVAAFFSGAALAAHGLDLPDGCVSDQTTHADYGLNKEGAWCMWDPDRVWKPAASIDSLVNFYALLIRALLFLGGGLQSRLGLLQDHVSFHQRQG